MGRIKTKPVKSAGDRLFEQHGDKFTSDFVKNKQTLGEHVEVNSKKIGNILAGYMTKKAKQR